MRLKEKNVTQENLYTTDTKLKAFQGKEKGITKKKHVDKKNQKGKLPKRKKESKARSKNRKREQRNISRGPYAAKIE